MHELQDKRELEEGYDDCLSDLLMLTIPPMHYLTGRLRCRWSVNICKVQVTRVALMYLVYVHPILRAVEEGIRGIGSRLRYGF